MLDLGTDRNFKAGSRSVSCEVNLLAALASHRNAITDKQSAVDHASLFEE